MHHCLYDDSFVVYNEGANKIPRDPFNQVRATPENSGAGPLAHNNSSKGFSSVEHVESMGFGKLHLPISIELVIEDTFSQKNRC